MADDCDKVLHELEIYLDGECGEAVESVVQRHLRDCPPCLDRADFERELRAMVAAKCRDCAPPGLLDRVLSRLHDL
ncbi:MAG: mycothiol system anti-sigma-R factor [Egibacteraceae bacterium]